MTKYILLIIASILIFNTGYSQNASTYFPDSPGYKWYYKNIPLDSNNIPQQNLARYRVDSFATVANYNGLSASIVFLKDNLLTINQNTPYNDTNYHNFQTTNGWEYVSLSLIPDSIPIPVPGLLNFLKGMENWYSIYRFASTVNSEYVIVSKDTTITVDTITAPIRAKMKGKRLNDEVVSTVNGNYTAKKFLITYGLYLHILIFDYPIVERVDTTWLATNEWMVRKISPTSNVNLSQLGIPINTYVPGNIYELTLPPLRVENISTEIPDGFKLFQNYPNPFNPNTIIKFQIPSVGQRLAFDVQLKIYDILGKEIAALVNEKLQPGTYEVPFSNNQLPSGVYFYRLQAGDFSEVKRMVLVK